MATKRQTYESSEKMPTTASGDRIVTAMHPAAPGTSNTSPAVPTSVITKLLVFTALMVFAPISVYFLTASTIFKGNNTWAGATAAVTANVVLIGYIIVAIKEDQGEDKVKVGKVE